ncbi:MAG: FAD-binding oxidoreductase [Blastocatellia bacterium]
MSVKELELFRSIESVLGSDNVRQSTALRVQGIAPSVLALPGCAREVAECLRISSKLRATVIPAGSMSWLDCGNQVRSADVVLSLERMTRVVDYSAPDLTVTVQAGLLLRELNGLTTRERQWLPLDPPGSSTASAGAVAACNSSGPLRLGFGTPRDYVLGLKLAHADGAESRCGGRVVKNVAGYDMNKLYVGSYGTLAVITELTFKLRPLPDGNATLVLTAKDPASLSDFAGRVIASDLQPASVFLTKGLVADLNASSAETERLIIRFIDNDAAVRHQVNWIKHEIGDDFDVIVLIDYDSESWWQRVADIDQRATNAVRISVPIAGVASTLRKVAIAGCAAAVDFGTGIVRVAFNEDENRTIETIQRLRSEAAESGGTLFVERASSGVKQRVDAWGTAHVADNLMRSVKAKFDPESVLNPGRFVAGI